MHHSSDKPEITLSVPVPKPFGKRLAPSEAGKMLAMLALSHTIVEHRLYLAMWSELAMEGKQYGTFGIRRLMTMTGLSSYGSIRRGCLGLINKLSVEPVTNGDPDQRSRYRVYSPYEVFERRRTAEPDPCRKEIQDYEWSSVFDLVVEEVVDRRDLSRREAFVSLCCAEGLSNAEIGEKLGISEKTVKYHLRHVFIKLGVKRRSELVGRLLPDSNRSGKKANGHHV
jgi:DNA-binding CsgD family transcriptional regulator